MPKYKRIHASLLTHLLLLCFTTASFSQSPDFNKIDSVVLKIMTDNKIVGLSIGIVKDEKIRYTKGYGTRQIRKSESIDSTTNFLTCSISKLFTATAIMQLVEQGKIDIQKKLTDYVPEFPIKDAYYKIRNRDFMQFTFPKRNCLEQNTF